MPHPSHLQWVYLTLLLVGGSGCALDHFCEPEEPYRASLPSDIVPPAVVPKPLNSPLAEQVPPGKIVAELPAPVTADNLAGTSATSSTVPISLAAALQMTAGQNPRVGFAEERVREAEARLAATETLWLPSLRAGMNYNKHEGRIQNVEGVIIDTSRGSVYTGLGAGAVGAGSPAIPGLVAQFHLRDAMLQPQIAESAAAARSHASRAALNDALLATALAYLDLLEAHQTRAIAAKTLAHAQSLADLTAGFARAGQGTQADADRAQTERSYRQIEFGRADEAVHVAEIRLVQQLSLRHPFIPQPEEQGLAPIELVPAARLPTELVALGLTQRPELAESQSLVEEAIARLRREQVAPLVPSVLFGLSYGGNGGGLGGNIERFGDRMDFDAMAFWEMRNLGYGDAAARRETSSLVRQARWQQLRQLDQVAAEIGEAQVQVQARGPQIEQATAGVAAAQESYRRNLSRIREGQGLPLEALQSLQALDQSERQLARVIADYDRAQFRLLRAVGWPSEL